VKQIALEKGIPLKDVKGSGPNGRITVEDVEKFKPSGGAAPGAPAAAGKPAYEDIPLSGMRKTIGNRLKQSVLDAPHYYVASSISVTKLLKLRQSLNASSDGKYKLSVNDFLVKAIAIASKKVPAVNASWLEKEGAIRQYSTVDVSVAVATKTGLITPIVKGVDGLGLETISNSIKDLGKRARDGKLKPEEYQGGTITISNLGMNSAVERFTAVINPPQSAILAIGTTKKVAVPGPETEDLEPSVQWDDQLVITASFDHRVVDGAVGGEFMSALKKVLENPLELLL
jgi:pyruvate dehydrogenase E2 component (dihydrolipoamide acetyltransferase)